MDLEIGEETGVLYICNPQHQKPDGTWHNHQPMVRKSLLGVAKVINEQNADIYGGLLFSQQKFKRRLQVRKVTLVETSYADLKRG